MFYMKWSFVLHEVGLQILSFLSKKVVSNTLYYTVAAKKNARGDSLRLIDATTSLQQQPFHFKKYLYRQKCRLDSLNSE